MVMYADADIMRSCTSLPTTVALDQSSVAYIASANYPHRYPIDSDCHWSIVARRPETLSHILLTIVDFELDVRRAGRCHDVLRVTTFSRTAPAGNSYQCQ